MDEPSTTIEPDPQLEAHIQYIKNAYTSFSLVAFYKNFEFGTRLAAEKAFKRCIAEIKRDGATPLRNWANRIQADDFEILKCLDIETYWRELDVEAVRKAAVAAGEKRVYEELILKFEAGSPSAGRKKKKLDSASCKHGPAQVTMSVPQKHENRWIVRGVDVSDKFFQFQRKAIKAIEGSQRNVVFEMAVFEIISVQHVLLLKPNQYSKSMLDTFGSTLLEDLHKAQVQCWVEDCQEFKNHEVEAIQDIIDNYQTGKLKLKAANAQLCQLTLEMSDAKSSAVNAVRRLMEKLPFDTLLGQMDSETELWSAWGSSSGFSPQQSREKNSPTLKCNDAGLERPDGVVSIVSQSNWGRNYCHGEVKVADKKEDKFLLAWDLVRLASFNKSLIDETDTPSALAFQLKGHKVTFYIMELMAEGLYAMTELTSIALPRSAQELSNLVSKKALRELSQVAYVFENIEKQSIQEACKSRKKQGPSLAQLGKLLSERKDRNLPCTLHF